METWYGYYVNIVKDSKEDFYHDYSNTTAFKLSGNDVFSDLPDGCYDLDDELFLLEKGSIVIGSSDSILNYYPELVEFEKSMEGPIDFTGGSYELKPFFGRVFEVTPEILETDYESYRITLDGQYNIDIVSGDGGYIAYDGVEGYGWYPSVKLALKSYLRSRYVSYSDGGYEDCSSCRGGGCFHCEPHRFI